MLAVEIDTSVLRPALIAGLVAALVAGGIALAALPRHKRVGAVGVPIAVATLFTLRRELGAPYAPVLLWAAVAAAFFAGEVIARSDHPLRWYALLVPGVMMAATNIPSVPVVARIAAAAAAVVTAVAASDLDRRHASQGLGVLLVVVTCWAPLFLTPGSDAGPSIAGASLFMVLLAVPKPIARVGDGGVAAVAVVYWWAVLISAGWPQGGDNMVAGLVCFGFLLCEPLARLVMHRLSGTQVRLRSTRDAKWLVVAVAVAAQAALVGYGAAVIAPRDMLDTALLAALPAIVIGTAVAVEVVPSPRRQSRHSGV